MMNTDRNGGQFHHFSTGGPISAQAVVADVDGDGRLEIVAGSDALYVWRADGSLLPSFPVHGRNFFASRPLVVDLYGDGRLAILVGCDDDALYGFEPSGRLLPGFPIQTGGDVYSSPAAFDLDGDGVQEIIVGSDDGCVYVWRADGTPFPGWPQQTGGFVSSSPVIADLAGSTAIVAGSWDGKVYAWRADGSPQSGWPQQTGHAVWSAPRVVDVDGDGHLEVIAASDRVYIWRADGSPLPGWPRQTTSLVVGTPASADVDGDGRMEIVAGADRLYAWHADSSALPGFPLDLGTYCWSAPVIAHYRGHSCPTIHICGWDGCLYSVESSIVVRRIGLSSEPIFATPTLADVDGDGYQELLVGAWDGALTIVPHDAQGRPSRSRSGAMVYSVGSLRTVREAATPFIGFPPDGNTPATMYYRADFEVDWHPVPLVAHQGQLTGLVQPFLAGTHVELWAHIGGRRVPEQGVFTYRVRADWPGRIRRWLWRLTGKGPNLRCGDRSNPPRESSNDDRHLEKQWEKR